MSKVILKLELDFESWMDESIEPKTNEEWEAFFKKHLIPYPVSIIGSEEDDKQHIISLNEMSIEVIDVKS
jgi:hypothetical protein